ncbi:HMG-box (high mobility group) DNA-binding family protein, partial [Striga asiatica]
MGLTNKSKKGLENLPIKRRELVKHRELKIGWKHLRRVELMQLHTNSENYRAETLGRFERIEQAQVQILEMMGRIGPGQLQNKKEEIAWNLCSPDLFGMREDPYFSPTR